jgi:hypothetical protein
MTNLEIALSIFFLIGVIILFKTLDKIKELESHFKEMKRNFSYYSSELRQGIDTINFVKAEQVDIKKRISTLRSRVNRLEHYENKK